MPRSLRPQFSVTPEEQGKLNKILKKFEAKEVKELTGSPQDLMYALKLIEHYKNIEETGGHLVKLFQPETPLSIEHYPAHKAFFDATSEYQQVLFRASNQTGKTTSGAYAISCWATGNYPDWWQGRVFDKAPCSVGLWRHKRYRKGNPTKQIPRNPKRHGPHRREKHLRH